MAPGLNSLMGWEPSQLMKRDAFDPTRLSLVHTHMGLWPVGCTHSVHFALNRPIIMDDWRLLDAKQNRCPVKTLAPFQLSPWFSRSCNIGWRVRRWVQDSWAALVCLPAGPWPWSAAATTLTAPSWPIKPVVHARVPQPRPADDVPSYGGAWGTSGKTTWEVHHLTTASKDLEAR
jgi:hypothetical protein